MPGFGCACSVTVPGGYVEWATECGIFFSCGSWLHLKPQIVRVHCARILKGVSDFARGLMVTLTVKTGS